MAMDAAGATDPSVQTYIDAIDPEHRPLFDRLHGLIEAAFPDVELRISYKMPTYVVGDQRLYVGVWNHGLSLYGWNADRSAAFLAAHPGLAEQKGTIKLRPT